MNITLARVFWACYQNHKQEKNNHINWTSSNFGTSKDTIKKMKRQPIEWGEIMYLKSLIPRI